VCQSVRSSLALTLGDEQLLQSPHTSLLHVLLHKGQHVGMNGIKCCLCASCHMTAPCSICTTFVGLYIQIVLCIQYCYLHTHYTLHCGICSVWIQYQVYMYVVYNRAFLVHWHWIVVSVCQSEKQSCSYSGWWAAAAPVPTHIRPYMLYCYTRHNMCASMEVLSLCKLLSDCTIDQFVPPV